MPAFGASCSSAPSQPPGGKGSRSGPASCGRSRYLLKIAPGECDYLCCRAFASVLCMERPRDLWAVG